MDKLENGMFESYSRYYDLLYCDKDYEAETQYVCALLERYGITEGELLEFGSGTGIHGRLLAKRGFRVHGIELSPQMAARARQIDGFTCQQGDIRLVEMGRRYNAVIALFHVMCYQNKNSDVNAVFARAAESLDTGGMFIFDFWYSLAVYSQKPTVRVKHMSSDIINVVRTAKPQMDGLRNIVNVRFFIDVEHVGADVHHRFSELHPMRHFSLPEIELFAELNGFCKVGCEAFLSGLEPDESTWSVTAILQKRPD